MVYKIGSVHATIGMRVKATETYATRVERFWPEMRERVWEVVGWEGERVVLRDPINGEDFDNARCNLEPATN